jgi:hypothetical protein
MTIVYSSYSDSIILVIFMNFKMFQRHIHVSYSIKSLVNNT